jgi:Spy/CpxP family protein refolding chaperone
MIKPIATLYLAFSLLLSLQAAAQSASNDDSMRRPADMRNPRLGLYMAENNLYEARILLQFKQEINLGADQVKKIEGLMMAHEERSIRDIAELKILELKFAALLKNDRINRKEMESAIRTIGQSRIEAQIKHLNYLVDLKELLTVEQIKKVELLREHMRHRLPGRLGERFQSGQGKPDDIHGNRDNLPAAATDLEQPGW